MLKIKNPFMNLYQFAGCCLFAGPKLLVGISMLILSACQTHAPYPQAIPVASFEGQWLDKYGILSTFNNGQFQTKTTDGTDTLLAVGTYQQVSPTFAKIELQSRVRKTARQIDCVLATDRRMNCTPSAGPRFMLMRRTNF